MEAADYGQLSSYEKERVDRALAKHGLTIDTQPEGKRLGEFYAHTDLPFGEREGILRHLNVLHVNTRDFVLLRQVLFKKDENYNERLVAQTERELLDPNVRSFALVFPVQKQGEEEADVVHMLVVSRDVHSLKLTTNLQLSGGVLSQLGVGLIESNFLGTNKMFGLNFRLMQYVMELQAIFRDPDLFYSNHELWFDESLLLNAQTGKYEGVCGHLIFEYPLDAETTSWGYRFQLDHAYEPRVDFQGAQVRLFEVPGTGEKAERKYRWLEVRGRALVTRSYGVEFKHNISFGYGLNWFRPTVFENFNLSGGSLQAFIDDVMPISEFQSFLTLGYSHFQNRFVAFYDYDTFGLEELIQLGPNLSVSAQFAAKPLLSDANFIRPALSAQYTWNPIPGMLVNAGVDGETRIQDGLINNRIQGSLSFASPVLFGAGRLVGSALFSKWYLDENNRMFTLGSDNGLRGMPLAYYLGNNFLRTNLEFRSVSWLVWLFRVGGVAFYDFGGAFSDTDLWGLTHSLGLGARILFLPFNRSVLRVDVAVPVDGPRFGFSNTLVTLGLGQAF